MLHWYALAVLILRLVAAVAVFWIGGLGALEILKMGHDFLFFLTGFGTLIAMANVIAGGANRKDTSEDVR